jgi:biotin synthase
LLRLTGFFLPFRGVSLENETPVFYAMTSSKETAVQIDFKQLARISLEDRAIHEEILLSLLTSDNDALLPLLEAAFQVRRAHHGARVQIQILSNAKSGLCPEDCHYCSQSCISQADVQKYPLKAVEVLMNEARRASDAGAVRFCMGLSGRVLTDAELAALCLFLERARAELNVDICCSVGFLTFQQAETLKRAGLGRVNHNLNTSRAYYPSICTTHTYQQRVENIKTCKQAGLDVCCGGIIGQGESPKDVLDMLLALKELEPASIPLNFLMPVQGTPFSGINTELTPAYCLKVLAVCRLIHPRPDIRVAGGREMHLRSLQPLAMYAANSIFVNGYLTEGGQCVDSAIGMIKDLGFTVETEGVA